MSETAPQRIVVFGAAGQLGQELISQLEELPSTFEIVGVVSDGSTKLEFEFRGESLDAQTTAPTLRAGDLVFVCTPVPAAAEIIRSALMAQAPCIDCTGSMVQQAEVPMPVLDVDTSVETLELEKAPLLSVPSATTLVLSRVLGALTEGPGVERVIGTVLRSASSRGRSGLVALSEESIALFNQSDVPEHGPAGQAVAFDVIPEAVSESRCVAELERIFGKTLRADVMSVQVPTFVGEGASLNVELGAAMEASEFTRTLEAIPSLQCVAGGFGSRGLAQVESGVREPTGPTLRESAGVAEILAGGIRVDPSLADGIGWRLWLSYDPVRITSEHAIRLAQLRFPGS